MLKNCTRLRKVKETNEYVCLALGDECDCVAAQEQCTISPVQLPLPVMEITEHDWESFWRSK